MNKIFITGRLTRDPETRAVEGGFTVTTFTIAVDRSRKREGQPGADFFRCTCWNKLGDNCKNYLSKGKLATVVGSVTINEYKTADGIAHASLEITADEVEFLSPKEAPTQQQQDVKAGFTPVDDDESLPF